MKQFKLEFLPKKTGKLLTELSNQNLAFLKQFYLTGGTALSLLLEHRESEDLDFFSNKNFDPSRLQTKTADAEDA